MSTDTMTLIPFHITWQRTTRSRPMQGIRYGESASQVRESLLRLLQEYDAGAIVTDVHEAVL